jgi:hypothetical protein
MRKRFWVASIVLGVGAVYTADVYLRDRSAGMRARKIALAAGKPLIVVGSGTDTSSATGAKMWGKGIPGSVHCDKAALPGRCSPDTVCHCDGEDLSQFRDKQFSVALASNFLRYVPNRQLAERELHRIADVVIVSDHVIRWPQIGAGSRWTLNGLW